MTEKENTTEKKQEENLETTQNEKEVIEDNVSDQKIRILDAIRPGDTIKVFEIVRLLTNNSKKTKSKEQKEKIQVFEGLVLARKHGKEIGATITVRKVIDGIGVEKIFPLHSPNIKKIEIVKRGKVRQAKLYYLREAKGKRARLKTTAFVLPEEPIQKEKKNKKIDNNVEEKKDKETPTTTEEKQSSEKQ